VGAAYGVGFALSSCVALYNWSVATGQLPPGLVLTTSAGQSSDTNNELTAHPPRRGPFTFTMKVTDSSGQSAIQQFSITIAPK
jgi:hypothetical protein